MRRSSEVSDRGFLILTASVAALAYRHTRHFIPLVIRRLNREAPIVSAVRKLVRNPGGMSPRRFDAREVLSVLVFEHAALYDVKEEKRPEHPTSDISH